MDMNDMIDFYKTSAMVWSFIFMGVRWIDNCSELHNGVQDGLGKLLMNVRRSKESLAAIN